MGYFNKFYFLRLHSQKVVTHFLEVKILKEKKFLRRFTLLGVHMNGQKKPTRANALL